MDGEISVSGTPNWNAALGVVVGLKSTFPFLRWLRSQDRGLGPGLGSSDLGENPAHPVLSLEGTASLLLCIL